MKLNPLSRTEQEFWNWFDPTAWYPLGRVVGGTIYPGLMATSGVIYNILHAINLPVDIRNICVLLAPGFSALTAWATYMCIQSFSLLKNRNDSAMAGSPRR
jgi:asparagine N-glycosylation enzyme membrane subunit Stt3